MWTESEAREKLCPFIQEIESVVDVATFAKPPLCSASNCMAWRWELTRAPLSPQARREAGLAVGLAYALQPATYERGYCGAAGQASGRPPIVARSTAVPDDAA